MLKTTDTKMSILIEYVKRNYSFIDKKNRPCKICGADSVRFDTLDFNKVCGPTHAYFESQTGIQVPYMKCKKCGFIFTVFFDNFTAQDWTDYVYNSNYYEFVDPDYKIIRPQRNAQFLDYLLESSKIGWLGLDYGGGNGLTAQLLIQRGYNFDTYDPFGVNTVKQENIGFYNFCSCFQVAEHSIDPDAMISDILRLCNKDRVVILIGTQTHKKSLAKGSLASWWYAAPRNGHVSLFSNQSLAMLASRYSLSCFNLSHGIHFLYRGYSIIPIIYMLITAKIRSRLRHIWKK